LVGGVGGAGDVVGGLGLSLVAVVVGCLGDVMGLAVVVVVVVVVMYLVGPAAAGGEVAVPPVAQHVVTVPVRPGGAPWDAGTAVSGAAPVGLAPVAEGEHAGQVRGRA